ncbi:hypothetical protein [uncultured Microscilla sp.]|uniref:hypothetical protein n=1 Tax=uncultured Microscilla sp. TaxID=432653 RepID=UPI00262CA562|nr:hypothetical protein [uncultured Microscilla sp.]
MSKVENFNIGLFYPQSNQLKKLPPVLVLRLQPDQHNAHSLLSVHGLGVACGDTSNGGEFELEDGF